MKLQSSFVDLSLSCFWYGNCTMIVGTAQGHYLQYCNMPTGTCVSASAVGMNNYAAPVQVLAAGQKNGWWLVVSDLLYLPCFQPTPRFYFTAMEKNLVVA